LKAILQILQAALVGLLLVCPLFADIKPGTYKLARAVTLENLEGAKVMDLSTGDTIQLLGFSGGKGLVRLSKGISGYISLTPEEGLFVGVAKSAVQSVAGPAEGKAWTVPGLDLTLQSIPAGNFLMGSPEDEPGHYDGGQLPTRVTITHAFWLGKFVVTQAQWKSVMATDQVEQARRMLASERGIRATAGLPVRTLDEALGNVGEDYPICCVSWDEAVAFCRKLNQREQDAGRLPPGYEYRLPTSQWEYACRAGTAESTYAGKLRIVNHLAASQPNDVTFAWNNDRLDGSVLDAIAWYGGNSAEGTTGRRMYAVGGQFDSGEPIGPKPVGHKQSNPWGLYDMLGNVTQWCSDWDGPDPEEKTTDPTGPKSGVARVAYGSSWTSRACDVRAARRWYQQPNERDSSLGFRLALVPAPSTDIP